MTLFYGFVFFAIKRTRCSSLIQPKTFNDFGACSGATRVVPKLGCLLYPKQNIQRFREIKHLTIPKAKYPISWSQICWVKWFREIRHKKKKKIGFNTVRCHYGLKSYYFACSLVNLDRKHSSVMNSDFKRAS